MRLGEIVGPTWKNVNWIEKIIRLGDTKNGEAREIPFSGELEIVLRAARKPPTELRSGLLQSEPAGPC